MKKDIQYEIRESLKLGDTRIFYQYLPEIKAMPLKERTDMYNAVLSYSSSYNHLSIIRFLLTSNEINPNPSILHNGGFIFNTIHKDILHYLFTSPETKISNLDVKYKNIALGNAVGAGDLDLVKYLLTSPDINGNAQMEHIIAHFGSMIAWAAPLPLLRYLCLSPEVSMHIDVNKISVNDIETMAKDGRYDNLEFLAASKELSNNININHRRIIFKFSQFKNPELWECLILKCNLPNSEDVQDAIHADKKFKKMVNDIFTKRELYDQLNQLPINHPPVKRVKI